MSAASFPFFDLEQTTLSQYANSPIIDQLTDNIEQYFDPTVNLQQFYDLVWNISTAENWGLDIWGRILGVSRYLTLPAVGQYFGFSNDGLKDYTGFGQAPFFSGATDTTSFRLPDDQYLLVLLAKALANICRCVAPVLNQLLRLLFSSSGPVWTQDNGNMTMSYVFSFVPTAVQEAMVTQLGILPRPAGVTVNIVVL